MDNNRTWADDGEAVSNTVDGPGDVTRALREVLEVTVKLNRLLADGDTVVALTEVTVGNERGHDADVFTLRDGKTVRVQVHTDTAVMERVYGTKKVAAG
jgi:ketosteroid isomerase-like protein